MKTVFLNTIILMVFLSLPALAKGQMRKVNSYNPYVQPHCEDIIYEYDTVDSPPQFPGGERGMINFINKIKKYPYSAYKHGIQGRVLCSFVVNADGSIDRIHIVRGVDPSLNKEAIRIIRAMPNWKSGSVDKEAVPVRCFLPIAFRL